MKLKFYLNGSEVKLNTGASFTETQDRSLDSGVVVLEFNSNPNAIAPMTPFQIEDLDSGESLNFVVVLDTVERVKKTTPALYKHTLTITQNTASLSKIQIRNCVFARSITDNLKTKLVFSGERAIIMGTSPDFEITFEEDLSPFYKFRGNTGAMAYNPYFQIGNNLNSIELDIGSTTYVFADVNGTDAGSCESVISDLVNSITIQLVKYRYDIENDTLTILNTFEFTFNGTGKKYITDKNTISQIVSGMDDSIYFRWMPKYANADCTALSNCKLGDPTISHTVESQLSTGHNYNFILDTVSINIFFDNYSYTLFDILEQLLLIAKKTYNQEETYSTTQLFSLPNPATSEDGQILANTIAPSFTFTQSDLYSCVAEVLSYIDAVPTLSEGRVLGLEFVNDNDYNKQVDVDEIVDLQTQLSDKNYSNKLTSYYQQARQTDSIFAPAKNQYKHLVGENYGIVGRDEYIFQTEQPIDYIDRVKMFFDTMQYIQNDAVYFFANNTDRTFTWTLEIADVQIDITPFVYESSEYAILPNSVSTFPSRQQAIYYEQGGTTIHCGTTEDNNGDKVLENNLALIIDNSTITYYGLAYNYRMDGYYTNGGEINYEIDGLWYNKVAVQKAAYIMNVEYHAIYDGRADIESPTEKYDGSTLVNQANGGVQLNRMGTNMLGLIAVMGNEAKIVSMPLTAFDERLKKGSIWVDDNGNRWIANKVKTTFSTDSNNCLVDIEFVKNFNELSMFTSLDQYKRFYEVDSSLVSKGYETIVEYLNFSIDEPTDEELALAYNVAGTKLLTDNLVGNTLKTNVYNKYVKRAMIQTFTGTNNKTDYYYINKISRNTYPLDDQTSMNIPIHSYGFGNMICFEMGYNDPLNAGDRLDKDESGYFGQPKYLSKPTLYAGRNGYGDMFSFYVECFDPVYDYSPKVVYKYFPIIYDRNQSQELIRISKYEYLKKPNEILHLNYEVAFVGVSLQEWYFGDKLILENAVLTDKKINGLSLYYSTTETYSIIDKTGKGNHGNYSNSQITITYNADGYYTLSITLNGPLYDMKSWALCDRDGNILIAKNNKVKQTYLDDITFYYFLTRERC